MNLKFWLSNFGWMPFKHWHKLLLCIINKHDWPVFHYGAYDSVLNKSYYCVTCAYCEKVLERGVENDQKISLFSWVA